MTDPEAELDRTVRADLAAVVAEVEQRVLRPWPEALPEPRRGTTARWLAAAAIVVVAAGVGGARLRPDGSGAPRSAAPPATVPSSGSPPVTGPAAIPGYDLPRDVRVAAAFPGNTRVVVATVTDVSDPFTPRLSEEAVDATGEEEDPALTSRRVSVRITRVLRGDDVAGGSMDLRIIEGIAPAGWSGPLEPGATIAIFGGELVAYEVGGEMLTPNHLLVASGGRFRVPAPVTPEEAEAPTLEELSDLVAGATVPGG